MSDYGSCVAYEDRGNISYIIRDYDPTSEFCQYTVPTVWINKITKTAWYLVSKEGGICEWIQLPKTLGPFIQQIITQCGTIEPDENGQIEFCAQDGLYVAADDCDPRWLDLLTKEGLSAGGRVVLGESLTFSLDFATNEETITGELATKPISPAALSAKLGQQTQNRFAVGAGSTNALTWANIVSPDGTISTNYDAVNKQFNIAVTRPLPTLWHEEELASAGVYEDAEDHYVYLGNAIGPITIRIKSKDHYNRHAQFYVMSITKGWQIEFLYPAESGSIYMDGKTGTLLKSSNNEVTNKDYVKLTFIAGKNIWIAEAHSSNLILS